MNSETYPESSNLLGISIDFEFISKVQNSERSFMNR